MSRFCRRLFLFGILAPLLSGCAVVDTYSPRAISYNLEAEEASNQELLLNIVRASLSRPMQFTDVQTIVGTTSGTGSLSASLPFYQHPSVSTGNGTTSLTGSTTFTVPVLDTQEFYEGLLAPIAPSTFDYFLSGPMTKELVFTLLMERITVSSTAGACAKHPHDDACERDLRNNPFNLEDIALFQQFADYLLARQLSTEAIPETKEKARSSTYGVKGAVVNVTNSVSADGKDAGPSKKYRLCFSPRNDDSIASAIQCGASTSKGDAGHAGEIGKTALIEKVPFPARLASALKATIRYLDPSDDAANSYGRFIASMDGREVAILIKLRSTADIFHFLGQLVAAEQGGPSIGIRGGTPDYGDLPCAVAPGPSCKPILQVDEPARPQALASIDYAGRSWSVDGGPYSAETMALLKTIRDLNVSAKSLPTTAVLSLTPTQ